MSISVCLASYNGERFIAEQLESIIAQLGKDDELILVDDHSSDNTLDVVRSLGDSRIRIFQNEQNMGDASAFSRAMRLANNPYVFLADQDDIWVPGRVDVMQAELEAGKCVVSSNFHWIDSHGSPIAIFADGVDPKDSNRHISNIVDIFIGKTKYFGCAMAYRGELRKVLLPVPAFVESHDLWLALVGNVLRSNCHLSQITLKKRKHGNNATTPTSTRSLYYKLRARLIFALSIVVIAYRYWRWGVEKGVCAKC